MKFSLSFLLTCGAVWLALYLVQMPSDTEDAAVEPVASSPLSSSPPPPIASAAPPPPAEPVAPVLASNSGDSTTARAQPSFPAANEFSVLREPDSHFYVNGQVNGVPVRFIVDSGASTTVLPMALAGQVGVLQGTPRYTNTANGVSMGVTDASSRVMLENIDVGRPEILFLPSVGTALLGQNVLRAFDIRIEGDRMTFKSRLP